MRQYICTFVYFCYPGVWTSEVKAPKPTKTYTKIISNDVKRAGHDSSSEKNAALGFPKLPRSWLSLRFLFFQGKHVDEIQWNWFKEDE